jgi:hypothetical protein
MTITVELTDAAATEIKACAARGDAEAVRRLLLEALTPAVNALMQATLPPLADEDFETLADQLADELIAGTGNQVPVLSEDAVSRQGLYEDHL